MSWNVKNLKKDTLFLFWGSTFFPRFFAPKSLSLQLVQILSLSPLASLFMVAISTAVLAQSSPWLCQLFSLKLLFFTCSSFKQSRTPYTTGIIVDRLTSMIPLVTALEMNLKWRVSPWSTCRSKWWRQPCRREPKAWRQMAARIILSRISLFFLVF